uniref:Uncharacterized protein n=1 Tax=Noccaea caerulescens TaxID=107243 RepID=A0A1J3JDY4_NOCCA
MKLEVFLHPLVSNSRTIYVFTKLHYLVQCLFDFDSVLDSMDPEILFISYNNPAENKKQVVIQTRCTVLAAIRAMISARITAPQPLFMPEDSWKLPMKVRENRKRRELENPPRMVNSSEEANFPL